MSRRLSVFMVLIGLVCWAKGDVPYAAPTDYGWRPKGWALTPDAQALTAEWNKTPYVPKNGRTAFIVRAQLKYGINRDDYIHAWYDRPLLQDSSLGQRIDSPTETKPWLNAGSWRKTVEMGRLGKQDAFAVFTCTSSREQVIPLSQAAGSESTILVELTRSLPIDECLHRAEQALAMPNSYRLGGKVVLTSYPQIREADLPHYAKLKQALLDKFGDKFLLMPYFTLFEGEASRGPFDAKSLLQVRARLEKALRVLDGLCQSSRSSYTNRRYDPWLCQNVMIPVVRGVFASPEFKDKYLAWWATPGHENSYRWNYGLDCTGTRMLRDTLQDIVDLRPDFFVGAEWDEENENTCFRPMVAHGFTHQRLLRYFSDLANRGGKTDVFPGDDVSTPNLVLSYRKELMAGEPLEVEVLNIPDGSFDDADITVGFAWKTPAGETVRAFPPQRLQGGKLAAAWFKEDVSKLVAHPALVPELTVCARDRKQVFSAGFWPVGLHATRCIEYKWTKQPLRDLPKDVAGGLTVGTADAQGVLAVQGTVKSARRLRSVAVLDGTDVVYMYDGKPKRDESTIRVRMAYQALTANGKNNWLKGAVTVSGAPGAQLRLLRSRGDIEVDGKAFRFKGAMYCHWLHMGLAEIPLAEAETAVFTADIPGFFQGTIALKDLLAKEVMSLPGPKGGSLVFTIFRSQEEIPAPQLVNAADFTFRLKPGLRNSILRMETVDEDYHVWRSAPFCCGAPTGQTATYHVFERDASCVSTVKVDSSRLPRIDYSFAPSRGTVIAGGDGRNLWGLAGGSAALVTGFGYGESGYGDTAAYTRLTGKTAPESTVPAWVQEADGSWALAFDGKKSYVSLPQQLWPVHAGFALEMTVCPQEVAKRQGLLTSGATSTSLWIEKGRVRALFFLRNVFFQKGGRFANVVVEGPAVAAGKWQTIRLVCDQQTAHLEVDGVRGADVAVSGDIFYPMYTALGVTQANDFFAGRMKSLKVEAR